MDLFDDLWSIWRPHGPVSWCLKWPVPDLKHWFVAKISNYILSSLSVLQHLHNNFLWGRSKEIARIFYMIWKPSSCWVLNSSGSGSKEPRTPGSGSPALHLVVEFLIIYIKMLHCLTALFQKWICRWTSLQVKMAAKETDDLLKCQV